MSAPLDIAGAIAAERQQPAPARIGARRVALRELVEESDAAERAHLEAQLGIVLADLGPRSRRWRAVVVGQHGPITACSWSWERTDGRPQKGRDVAGPRISRQLRDAIGEVLADGETIADLVDAALWREVGRRR